MRQKKDHRIVTSNEMQVHFMPERKTDVMFVLRRMQEEYHAKGKSCIYILWTWRKLLTEFQRKCWNGQ